MDFEWDEDKNRINIRNHGLDLTDAREIFDAPMLVEADNRGNYGEERLVGIGFLRNFIVVVVFTELEQDIIRVISLRKALKYEREKLEKAIRDELG